MKVRRKSLIFLMALIAIFFVSTNSFAQNSTLNVDKPNIVFIFADDLGWGDISLHGHPDIRTPNIDRLAEEGSEFHQFSVSNPVCSPSRVAIMTGQYPSRHNVNRHFASFEHHDEMAMGDWLDSNAVMLPRLLQQAGYKTAHFGKWHLGSKDDAPLPVEYGYDETAVFNGGGPQTDFDGLYNDAVDFIEQNKDAPFFINLWIHETHLPHIAYPGSLEKYKHLNEQDRIYAAVVDGADQRIGKVLDALDRQGLSGNTLVIFSSDNGPEQTGTEDQRIKAKTKPGAPIKYGRYYSTGSSGGLRGGKRSTYEGGLRVPFLVRWPGEVPAGRVDTQSIVTAVDMLPTFVEAAGAKLPQGYQSDGQSVLPLLKGGDIERDKPMFWEWRYGKSTGKKSLLAVREGPWKLFVYRNGEAPELYHLLQDRAETINLADEHPAMVKRMTALALAWKATLPDTPPLSALSAEREQQE